MAGGSSKRPGGIPLGERTRVPLHGSVEGLRRPPGPDPMAVIRTAEVRAPELKPGEAAEYREAQPRHVWVNVPDAPNGVAPGLLVEWRRPPGEGWEGRVVYLDLIEGEWIQAQAWLPADRVEPV